MSVSRERVVRILQSLPEVTLEAGGEREQHLGASVRKKRFAWYLDDHHGDGRVAVTCKAPSGVNESMVRSDPQCYFIPSYTGPKGWVGAHLDVDDVDWDRVEPALVESYRMTAPKSLVAQIDLEDWTDAIASSGRCEIRWTSVDWQHYRSVVMFLRSLTTTSGLPGVSA